MDLLELRRPETIITQETPADFCEAMMQDAALRRFDSILV